jgi:hypothetical protein
MAPYFLTVHLPQGFSEKDEEGSCFLLGLYEDRPQAFWVTDLFPLGEAILRLHRKPYRQHGSPPVFELYDAADLDPEHCGAFQQDVDRIKEYLKSPGKGPEAASPGGYRVRFLVNAHRQAQNLEPMVLDQLRRRKGRSPDVDALRSIAGALRKWVAPIETCQVDRARRTLRLCKRPADLFWQKFLNPLGALLKSQEPEPSPAELQRRTDAEKTLQQHKEASRRVFDAVSGKLKLLCSCADSFGCFAAAQKGLDFIRNALSSENGNAVFEAASLPSELLSRNRHLPARWRVRGNNSALADEIDRWADELEKSDHVAPVSSDGDEMPRSRQSSAPVEAPGQEAVHDSELALRVASRLEEWFSHRLKLEGCRTTDGQVWHLNAWNVSFVLADARPLVLALEFEGRGILATRLERLIDDVKAETSAARHKF